MSLNVLVTMVGAQTSPGILRAIKDNGEREIHLIGVDPVELIPGASFVDSFYRITPSFENEEKFIDELLDIANREKVDIILPCGNEDCLAISKNICLFKEQNIIVISSNYATLINAFDKHFAYNLISKHSPENAPESYLIKSLDDFIHYAEKLGYPHNKIVMKPRHGRGGRGVYIIDPKINLHSLLSEKPSGSLPYQVIMSFLEQKTAFSEFLLMEYLPGDIYSVYCLCNQGNSVLTIPNKRIWGTASNTLIGEVTIDHKFIEPAEKLCQEFKFDYNINIEMKISRAGIPIIFDVNPRIAASTAIFRSIGCNLPYLSIKIALGESLNLPSQLEDVVMLRYLKEIFYSKKDGVFFDI